MYVELSDADRNPDGMQFPLDTPSHDYDEVSDEELVTLFVEDKDESAFNEIVNRYGEKIHRLALRITHNTRYADEVLQEVFLHS